MLPEKTPSTEPAVARPETPTVSVSLQSASTNADATKAKIAAVVQPTVVSKPDTDVVFQTTTQSSKPSVDTIRDANQRIANFLSSQKRPTRRSAA